jgi:hypothetical protein
LLILDRSSSMQRKSSGLIQNTSTGRSRRI